MKLLVNECTYPPSDDTELLIEAMEELASRGRAYDSVIDIGSGSGVLALAAQKLLGATRLAAVDASFCAALSAKANLGARHLVAVCPNAACIRGRWDLAIVNPPYLDEEPGHVSPWNCEHKLWWAGRGLMEAMVSAGASLAREVLVASSTLSPVDPKVILASKGLRVEVLASRSFFMERLEAVWAWRG